MKVYIIFGQRKETYEGQYAPEALEIIDEFAADENPTWLKNKFEDFAKQKIFSSLEIVMVNLDGKKLDTILNPKNELKGEIQ